MVKNTKRKNTNNKRTKSRGKGMPKQTYNGMAGSVGPSRELDVLRGHWDMLKNPCFANLSESAYRGQSGFVQRFCNTRNLTTGSDTAFLAAYTPGACASMFNSAATSATTFTPVYSVKMPGQDWLTINASSFRCIGFCVDIEYVGTELARCGMIGSGTMTPATLAAGVLTNVDNVTPLFPNVCRLSDSTMTAKWFPGPGNERYGQLGTTGDLLFGNDVGALAIYGASLPAGLQLRLVETAIYEWVPRLALGLTTSSTTQGTNPPGAFEKLHDAASRDPSFTHSFAAGASHKLGVLARHAGEAAVNVAWEGTKYLGRRAVRSAMSSAPLLLM